MVRLAASSAWKAVSSYVKPLTVTIFPEDSTFCSSDSGCSCGRADSASSCFAGSVCCTCAEAQAHKASVKTIASNNARYFFITFPFFSRCVFHQLKINIKIISQIYRQEKAPGEVKRKTFVGIIKICCAFLVRFADKRRNSEPHKEVLSLENQHLFMFKTPCGDMKTRDVRTNSIPGGSFRIGLRSATIQPSVNTLNPIQS